ncbi:MAG TPA: glycoside hydrolase family 2 protein, partial [Bacteroidota bacterium]|nr:glycoside hydrolase family 2 protein [Bacteroidota bacterium]
MKTLSLDGRWQFRALRPAGNLPGFPKRALRWMNASVPGTVHTDLMACGLLQDPFYRMREKEAQWVEHVDWVYRRQFDVQEDLLGERAIELVAAGLDTFAEIHLNGRRLGDSANMFVEHRFAVKQALRHGRNVLEVRFASPVRESKRLEHHYGALQVALESHRVYVRKAQYSFGWDWGPKLTTSGIWRSIALEAFSGARILYGRAKVLSLTRQEALVEFSCDVRRLSRRPVEIRLFVGGPDRAVEYTHALQHERARMRVRIPNPRLWWPNGHGDHPLYTAVLTLLSEGEVLDEQQLQFGIRTVRLLQE